MCYAASVVVVVAYHRKEIVYKVIQVGLHRSFHHLKPSRRGRWHSSASSGGDKSCKRGKQFRNDLLK